eukprot:TRINITY_DN6923_c0_g2_i1.p1 TRINITY_DN6923_c0_g2~~TRINITY_DN6923_c0_g2_i1.p1  ORF type:complete len:1258 (-),score=181.44 TRINITY_DN6923_c0_g2_i1:241-4014(-)
MTEHSDSTESCHVSDVEIASKTSKPQIVDRSPLGALKEAWSHPSDKGGASTERSADMPTTLPTATKLYRFSCCGVYSCQCSRKLLLIFSISGCCVLLALIIAALICGLLLQNAAGIAMTLEGARMSLGCEASWAFKVRFALDNPSPFSVEMESGSVELRQHSVGSVFAAFSLTDNGPLKVYSGVSTHQLTGTVHISDPRRMASALEEAVIRRDWKLMDVAAVVRVKVKSNAILGLPLSMVKTKTFTTADFLSDSESAENECFSAPALVASTVNLTGGGPASISGSIDSEVRTGPCKPSWDFLEMDTPKLLFAVESDMKRRVVDIALPPQTFDLRQPTVRVQVSLAVSSQSASAAADLLWAASGLGGNVSARVVARVQDAKSDVCAVQDALAALRFIAEADISNGSASERKDESSSTSMKVVSVVGNFGGVGSRADMEFAVNLSRLAPNTRIKVVGSLPPLSIMVMLERRSTGCPQKKASVLVLRVEPDTMTGQEEVRIRVSGATTNEFNEAVAVGVSSACTRDSELTIRFCGANVSSNVVAVCDWWEISFPTTLLTGSGDAVTATVVTTRVRGTSSPDDVNLEWLLGDLVDASSIWADTSIVGSMLFASSGVGFGGASVAARRLATEMRGSLRLGSDPSAKRTEVLSSLKGLLQPLWRGERPNVSAEGVGDVNVSLANVFNGTLGAAMTLWPDNVTGIAAAAVGSRSTRNATARLELSGSAHIDRLRALLSLTIIVGDDLGAQASGELVVSGMSEETVINVTLTLLDTVLASSDLGLKPCGVDGVDGDGKESWSLNSIQAAFLGGSAPGMHAEFPCVFKSICEFVEVRSFPLTFDLSARVVGTVALVALETVQATLDTAVVLEVTAEGNESTAPLVVATVSLLEPGLSVASGAISARVQVVVTDEAGAARLVQGGSWSVIASGGSHADFLGDLCGSVGSPLAEGPKPRNVSKSPTGGSDGMMALLDDMTLTSTDSLSMFSRLECSFTNLLGFDAFVFLGDVIDISVFFDDSFIASAVCMSPRINGSGTSVVGVDFGMHAHNLGSRQSLERAIGLLVSDTRETTPFVKINGTIAASEVPGGFFPFSMTVALPNLFANKTNKTKEDEGGNKLVKIAGWTIEGVSWQISTVSIEMEVGLQVTIINPMWFDAYLSTMGGSVHLYDLDGYNFAPFLSASPAMHHVYTGWHDFNTLIASRQNITVDVPIHVSASTAWRMLDEDLKDQLTIRVSNATALMSIKHESSEEAFNISIPFIRNRLKA